MTLFDSKIIKVTNISPGASTEQIKTLFSFLGNIESMELYPKLLEAADQITKVAFVMFSEPLSVQTSQHLTNTVFVDRALICVPFENETIPGESDAMLSPVNIPAHAMQPTTKSSVDPAKLDEIQRTIYVSNLDFKSATSEKLVKLFSPFGEVRYTRLAGDESARYAFIEFTSITSAQQAVTLNGSSFCERVIRVNLSNVAIVKPPGKSADAREIDEAMRRVREAQSLIAKALEPEKGVKRPRSRSRSRHRRHRSRSRDRSRRHHSRSHSSRRRSRSRSRDRSRRSSRSKSRGRGHKSSRDKKASRSPHKKSSSSSRSHRKKDDKKREKSKKSKKSDDEKRSKKHKSKNGDEVEKEVVDVVNGNEEVQMDTGSV